MTERLYRVLSEQRNPDRLEHWIEFNQIDFRNWYIDRFLAIMDMPDYDSEDYIE